jgi:RNA polymerase sigma-70 factor (ECF subfamily)
MSDETPSMNNEGAGQRAGGTAVSTAEVKAWFVSDVLPLEAMLMRFLYRNWRNPSDAEDLRQEVYAHVLKAAETKIPERTKPFVFATARNLIIDRLRRENIVPIEIADDQDLAMIPTDEPGPERSVSARDTLRKLQLALDQLPPRCREALVLQRIEGLSRREIAQRMGIGEQAVANYVQHGLFVLADLLFAERTLPGGEHEPA